MKVLKEAKKETLPLDFLTSYISRCWDEIGVLKADIEGLSQVFKGSKKVEEIIQGLLDAYLTCVGQLEAFVDKKDYLDIPEAEQLKEGLSVEDCDNQEACEITNLLNSCTDPKVCEYLSNRLEEIKAACKNNCDNDPVILTNQEVYPDTPVMTEVKNDNIDDKIIIEIDKDGIDIATKDQITEAPIDEFEYFTDFEEPEIDAEDESRYKEWISTPHNLD